MEFIKYSDIFICHSNLGNFQQLFLKILSAPFSLYSPSGLPWIYWTIWCHPLSAFFCVHFFSIFFFFSSSVSIISNVLSLSSLISSSACLNPLLSPSSDFLFHFSYYIYILALEFISGFLLGFLSLLIFLLCLHIIFWLFHILL